MYIKIDGTVLWFFSLVAKTQFVKSILGFIFIYSFSFKKKITIFITLINLKEGN